VYCEQGIDLWSRRVDNVDYTIRLQASNTDLTRCEGALNVSFYVRSVCITTVAFSWVDSHVFGVDLGIIPFVTRNQSARKDSAELQLFRKAFPQNSPPYFCVAALRGIAEAHSVKAIAAIRYNCQFSFRDELAQGFRSSYCKFWYSIGAVELDTQALLMPVELTVPPVSAVKTNHRMRAILRRSYWLGVTQNARAAVSRYRIGYVARLAGAVPALSQEALRNLAGQCGTIDGEIELPVEFPLQTGHISADFGC
jgi:uncharacterized protein